MPVPTKEDDLLYKPSPPSSPCNARSELCGYFKIACISDPLLMSPIGVCFKWSTKLANCTTALIKTVYIWLVVWDQILRSHRHQNSCFLLLQDIHSFHAIKVVCWKAGNIKSCPVHFLQIGIIPSSPYTCGLSPEAFLAPVVSNNTEHLPLIYR